MCKCTNLSGSFLYNKTKYTAHALSVFHLSATYPKNFFLLKKSTSFPNFISEKIISIDKILVFLQAFEHLISMFTTVQSRIWVGLLVTGTKLKHSRDFWMSLEGCQTFLGYSWLIFYRNRTRFLHKRTVSSSITIWSLATIWTTVMYIYFFHFKVRVASGDCCVVIQFARIRIDNLPVHLGYNGTSNCSRVKEL